jgi:predicted nucleic acid-binding protein
MSAYLFDTSALLALRDNEPGADRVAELLDASANGGAACYGCFITLMEVMYRVWKDEGEEAGRAAYSACQLLAISWRHENSALLERAAEIKARFPLSLADAWIAAAALEVEAVLVHKDPEFERVDGLKQELLPYK